MTINTSPLTSAKCTLVAFDEDGPTERRLVLQGGVCEVGRGNDCERRISSSAVSKRHARLIFSGGQLVVEDLDSTNGTFVNGNPVSQSALVDRDMVQVANALFRIELSHATEHDGTVEEGLVQWAHTR